MDTVCTPGAKSTGLLCRSQQGHTNTHIHTHTHNMMLSVAGFLKSFSVPIKANNNNVIIC